NYSPFKHPENCQRRKSVVLNAMLKQKHITSAEKERALHEPLPTKAFENTTDKSYFSRVFDELETISEKTGIPVYGKMKIYTYLDGELQKELSLLPQTDTDRIYAVFNRRLGGFSAYHSTIGSPKRLPGSVLKPLLVYAPALEEGIISPATPILDEKTDFSGYEPKNYGNTYSGYISARESLSKSLNIPAVKILSATGVKKSAEYLNRTDLKIPQDDYSLALALGGMKKGFTLTELVNAYTLFPNGGVYQEGSFIKKIVVGGKTVYRKKEKSSRIFSEETAYLVTDMLQSAIKSGTAKKLSSLPFSIAAKTGTCGNKDGNTDAYSLSYTSDYTVGVWMGNADNTLTNVTGGGVCCNHALSVHEYLAKRNKPKDFTTPNNIVRCRLDGFDYKQSQKLILADEQAPPIYCVTEIFNRKFLPKSKSERFSKPFVQTPNVAFENGLFSINTEQLPNYYSYKLERFDGEKTTIVFDGIIKNALSDTPPTGEKSYRYTLTPYYKEFMGTPIVFPNVTTKENLLPVIPETPPEIIEKDWWDY
ncbi:MAG: hypothetical protein IIX01_04845, partial [Clostridia bacterium]|nr:hypothetical protein [Clostridia bacterium]